jgi:CDP-glucose 4,6-dehydratase
MGATVKGYSLEPPTSPSMYMDAAIADGIESIIGDVRNYDHLHHEITSFNPDVLIHMAAQPLVRLSYEQPQNTYAINVMGTVNILEAAKYCRSLKAIVNVTTDKCYENKEWVWGYREDEPMGGYDPYSNSKGCAELVTTAYRKSFFFDESSPALASGRAGNVIGGGDWALDRLLPDALRAFEKKEPLIVRNPYATRPWQHVLDCLSGYLVLAENLFNNGNAYAEGWNFGPKNSDVQPVKLVLDKIVDYWGEDVSWKHDNRGHPHEAQLLKLDISKAAAKLNWYPTWSLDLALLKVVDWHKCWISGGSVRDVTLQQIYEFMNGEK